MSRILRDPDEGDAGGGALLSGASDKPIEQRSWQDSLPDDIKGDAHLAGIADVPALAKGYLNAQSLIGKKSIGLPEEGWTPDQHGEFFDKLGRPTDGDGYKNSEGVKLAEGVAQNPEAMKEARALFHKIGLTESQGRELLDFQTKFDNANFEAGNKSVEDGRAKAEMTLKQDFGDDYANKMDLANSVLKQFGDEAFIESLVSTGLANNVSMVKFLANAGAGMLEDQAHGRGLNRMETQGPGAAKAEIANLTLDKQFMNAWNTHEDPGHAAAVERWTRLHKVAYPNPT